MNGRPSDQLKHRWGNPCGFESRRPHLTVSAGPARERISLTSQHAAVDEILTGEENLRLFARLWHLPRLEARPRIDQLLDRFDLLDTRARPVKTYSGGMRRRLDLALSILRPPAVLFLDEPTTGLDPRSRATLWSIIRDLAAEGITVLLTTQYLDEANRLADWIYLLDGGTIVAEGPPDDLKARIGGEVARLRFDDRTSALQAAMLIGAGTVERDAEGDWLHVPTDGTRADIQRLLGVLAAHGFRAARLTIQRPTLDDVFLNLTRRTAPLREVA